MSGKITKENMIPILKDLSKEYRKHGGKDYPAEIILVGGAAIVAMYDFRTYSMDMDALIFASSALKDAVTHIGEKYDLQYKWLNDDFKNTNSYSPKIREYSRHYRTFANVVEVRIIKPEYLVAMKLKAGRYYKHDLSDVVEIFHAERQNNASFSAQNVLEALQNMYGNTELPQLSQLLLDKCDKQEINLEELKKFEEVANEKLRKIIKESPDIINQNETDELMNTIEKNDLPESLRAESKCPLKEMLNIATEINENQNIFKDDTTYNRNIDLSRTDL